MTLALVLAAALAVAAVVVVALPYLREPHAPSDLLDEPDPETRRRLELVEERDRALAALKELELDHRMRRISDEDYRTLVGPLRREAAEALSALARTPAPSAVDDAVDDTPAAEAARTHDPEPVRRPARPRL